MTASYNYIVEKVIALKYTVIYRQYLAITGGKMPQFIEEIRNKIAHDVFTDLELKNALPISANSRYGLVKRAIAQGNLIHICRGVYAFSKRYQRTPLSIYAVAQKIYRPSYVSLESALSHHGLIPEHVPTITSSCAKRSHEFQTPLATFSYSRIPWYNYIGVDRIEEAGSPFFMAGPEKALADYVYVYKKDWQGMGPLLESLRIEEDDVKNLSVDTLAALRELYKNSRVRTFVDGLLEDITP